MFSPPLFLEPCPKAEQLKAGKISCGGENFLGVGEEGFLERRSVRDGCVERCDADEGPVEIVEGFFGKDGGDFTRNASGFGVFVDDQALIGFSHGVENGFFVERHERAQVNDIGFDTFLREGFGGFQRDVHHGGVGKNREVFSFATNDRLP